MAIAIAGMYLIVGIITARFLEKRRMRAGTVLYTILFLLIAFLLLLIPEGGWAADVSRKLYGEQIYGELREILVVPGALSELSLTAALVAEGICLAMFLFSIYAAIADITEKIPAEPKGERVEEAIENGYQAYFCDNTVWLRLCRIRS